MSELQERAQEIWRCNAIYNVAIGTIAALLIEGALEWDGEVEREEEFAERIARCVVAWIDADKIPRVSIDYGEPE